MLNFKELIMMQKWTMLRERSTDKRERKWAILKEKQRKERKNRVKRKRKSWRMLRKGEE